MHENLSVSPRILSSLREFLCLPENFSVSPRILSSLREFLCLPENFSVSPRIFLSPREFISCLPENHYFVSPRIYLSRIFFAHFQIFGHFYYIQRRLVFKIKVLTKFFWRAFFLMTIAFLAKDACSNVSTMCYKLYQQRSRWINHKIFLTRYDEHRDSILPGYSSWHCH